MIGSFEQEFKNKAVVLDIESEGAVDFKDKRIYAVGFKSAGKTTIICEDDEAVLLRRTAEALVKLRGRWILGHNVMQYDLPHILARCERYNIPVGITRKESWTGQPIIRKLLVGGVVRNNYREMSVTGCQIVDTMFLAMSWDAIHAELSSHGLKVVAQELGIRPVPRLELSLAEIQDAFKNDRPRLFEYLGYDLEDTFGIAKKLLPAWYYMQVHVPMHLQEIIVTTTARKVEAIIEAHYRKKLGAAYVKPTPEDTHVQMQGAETIAIPGLHKGLVKLDISSLYPTLMLEYRIWPSRKDPDEVFLKRLRELTDERLALKAQGKTDPDALLRSDALKILINSFYGFLKSSQPYNDVQAAAKVTAGGRDILHKMMDATQAHGCTVVEADTDGIIVSGCTDTKALLGAVQAAMPPRFKVDLEWTAAWSYIHAAKNYIVHDADGKEIRKGLFKKRDRMKLQNIYVEKLCEALLDSREKALSLRVEIIDSINSRKMDPALLSVTRKIAVTHKALLAIGKPGDRVTYWTSVGSGGEPMFSTDGTYFPGLYVKEIDKLTNMVFEDVYGKGKGFRPEGTMESLNLFTE